MWQLLFIMIIG